LVLMMKDNVIKLDWDDEVIAKTALTHAGKLKSDAAKPEANPGRAIIDTSAQHAAKVA
jgi:NAD(P) transhydrogenase subunit alpha